MAIKISINKDILENELKKDINFDTICTICGDNLNDSICHTLNCKHIFHYNCLIKYLQTDFSFPRSNKCPYCKTAFTFLPLIGNIKPIKFIHYEYYNKSLKNQEKLHTCNGIYTSGKNKGEPCNNKISELIKYCRYHYNQDPNNC
jgi:hypothetical protein